MWSTLARNNAASPPWRPLLSLGAAVSLAVGCSTRYSGPSRYEYPEQAEHFGGLRLDRLSYEDVGTKQKVSALWAQVQQQGNNASPRFELSRILLRHQYNRPAITLLSSPCCMESGSPQYYLLLAKALVSDSSANLPRSTVLLEEGVRVCPGSAQLHAALGHAYNGAGRTVEALVEFEKTLGLAPPLEIGLSARLGKAAAFRKQDKESAAQKELAEIRRIYPGVSQQLDNLEANGQLRPLEPSEYFGDDGVHPLPNYRAELVRREIERIKKENP